MAESPSFALLEQIRSGNRQFQLLAAEGVLPIPPEELIPVQVDLAHGDDAEIAGKARHSLRTVDVRLVLPFLERQAGAEALAFFAEESSHPMLLEAILRRRDVPRSILARLARRLPPDLQEILLLRQDAIVEEPVDPRGPGGEPAALHLHPAAHRRVPRAPAAARAHHRPSPPRSRRWTRAALAREIEAARELPPAGEVEPERTELTEGQIRGLPIPARLKLTRGAPRALRSSCCATPTPRSPSR